MKRTRYTLTYRTRSGLVQSISIVCLSEEVAREAATILRDLQPGQIQTVTKSEP
jgi:hypothetical protein